MKIVIYKLQIISGYKLIFGGYFLCIFLAWRIVLVLSPLTLLIESIH